MEESLRDIRNRVEIHGQAIYTNTEAISRQNDNIRRLEQFNETQQKIYIALKEHSSRQNRLMIGVGIFLAALCVMYLLLF